MAYRRTQTPFQLTPLFRPGIIIYLGETGWEMYQHAGRLFAGLDEPLRASVAAFHYSAAGKLRRVPLIIDGSGASDLKTLEENDSLNINEAMLKAVGEVQDYTRRDILRDADYALPNPRTQCLIVGTASEPTLSKCAREITDALRGIPPEIGSIGNFDTLVLYVLSYYQTSRIAWMEHLIPGDTSSNQSASGNASDSLSGQDSSERANEYSEESYKARYSQQGGGQDHAGEETPRVTFALLSNRVQQSGWLYQLADVNYIVAEAVFALVATGMTIESVFKKIVEVDPTSFGQRSYLPPSFRGQNRRGSLGVCMIRFPRAAAEIYWIDRLAAQTVQDWADKAEASNAQSSRERRQTQQNTAIALIRGTLVPWLNNLTREPPKIKMPTGGASPQYQYWPTRETLTKRTSDSIINLTRSLEGCERQLDLMRINDSADKIYAATEQSNAWSESARQAFIDAEDHHRRWQDAAQAAWTNVQQEVKNQIERMVDDLWLGAQTTWTDASTYIEAVTEELTNAVRNLSEQRKEQARNHAAIIATYERRTQRFQQAPGSIIAPEGTEDTLTPIKPTGANIGGGSGTTTGTATTNPTNPTNPNTASSPGQSSDPPPAAPPRHRPHNRERDLIEQMGRYADDCKRRLVSPATLIAAAVAAFPTFFLLASASQQALLNTTWGQSLLALGVGGSLLGSGVLYRWMQFRQLQQARSDHVQVMQEILRYRRFQRENQLTTGLLMLTRLDAQDMRDRLRDLPGHLHTISAEFRDEANKENEQLFDGPTGRHDVLIANGQQIRSLEPIYSAADILRKRYPHAPWHTTFDEISAELRNDFRSRREGVIGLAHTNFKDRIRVFLRRHFLSYLAGDMGAINSALDEQINIDARNLWNRTRQHSAPLYSMQGADIHYVSGTADDLAALDKLGIAPHEVELKTKNPEWLLAATLRYEMSSGT